MNTPETMEELNSQLEHLFNLSVTAIKDCIIGEISEEDRDRLLADYDLKGKECIKNAISLAISSHNKELVGRIDDDIESIQSFHEKKCIAWSGIGDEDYPDECDCVASKIKEHVINLIKDSK
jgi:hypothetical protein